MKAELLSGLAHAEAIDQGRGLIFVYLRMTDTGLLHHF